jgi:hypothetical protein
VELLVEIEDEWRDSLGEQRFNQFKTLLCDVWKSGLIHKTRS